MTEQHGHDLIERVREGWGRPELSDAERAEFDAQLRGRLDQPQPRRWARAGAAVAAVAAVSMVVFSVRDNGGDEVDWFDTLVDAQAVVMGESGDSDSALRYGFDLSEDTSVPLFADPAWDSSADTVWDSKEALDLGHEYEVLAFWLAAPTDGDGATSIPGVP
jgi:hypothetical protein